MHPRQAGRGNIALARGELQALGLELPAGRHDVAPARRAHGARIARAVHDLGEALDLLPVRAFVRRAGPGIERDQVDLGGDAGEQTHERLGVLEAVVDALQHHVLEGDAARVGEAGIGAAGSHQLGNRILAVDRHQLVAQFVAHGVQRDGEHGAGLLAPAGDLGDDAAGRERDAPLRHGEAVAVGGNRHRIAHVSEIVERLAHAHQHDVGDLAVAIGNEAAVLGPGRALPVADAVARQQDLADDLLGRQVAHEPLRAGVAERAGERAADLARDAQRAAVGLGDVDGLDLGGALLVAADGQAQQPLAGAVDGHLLGCDLGPGQRIGARQGRPQVLGDVRHVLEGRGAANVDPAPQLADTHPELLLRHADGGQRRAQALAAEARKGGLGRGGLLQCGRG